MHHGMQEQHQATRGKFEELSSAHQIEKQLTQNYISQTEQSRGKNYHTSSIGSIFWYKGSSIDNAFAYSWRWNQITAYPKSISKQTNQSKKEIIKIKFLFIQQKCINKLSTQIQGNIQCLVLPQKRQIHPCKLHCHYLQQKIDDLMCRCLLHPK